MTEHTTQVGIIGAGPAGLMLGHLLHLNGIDSVIIERASRDHVIGRVRAGVLEQGTVDLLIASGVGDRLLREGMRHNGAYLRFDGERHHIDFLGLTGRAITVYAQNEVVKDLIAARDATTRRTYFSSEDVALATPEIHFRQSHETFRLTCDFIAGCDGFHGVSRQSIPAEDLQVYERTYPYAWLGFHAYAPPSCDELVYSLHDSGFALFSMRSPSVSRLCLQCTPDEDLANWPDERIWETAITRLASSDGWRPNQGEIYQKSIAPMRSFVAEPMRHGHLFLAGDAAHIVPPTGAKGMNLAISDVRNLAEAFTAFYHHRDEQLLEQYSAKSLRRVWNVQRFSSWMTALLHRDPSASVFERRRQLAELNYLTSSQAAMTSLAENYTGLPE